MPNAQTRENILDVAQEFLQTRGFNAFSFRDVAKRVGIKSASIHHYFPTKTDLCRALIARQRTEVNSALNEIDVAERDPILKLERYIGVVQNTLEIGNRMCLCGMLAADIVTLDPSIVEDLRLSFEDHELWLERVLTEGKGFGLVRFEGSSRDEARLLLGSLEGAMLIARSFEDSSRFQVSSRALISKLKTKPVNGIGSAAGFVD